MKLLAADANEIVVEQAKGFGDNLGRYGRA